MFTMWVVGSIGVSLGPRHPHLTHINAPICLSFFFIFQFVPIWHHTKETKRLFFFFFFINQNIKGQFGFKKNHHSSFLTQFLSLIIYHLKYPNFLNPTCLAHCFQLLITQIFVLSVGPIPEQLAKDFY